MHLAFRHSYSEFDWCICKQYWVDSISLHYCDTSIWCNPTSKLRNSPEIQILFYFLLVAKRCCQYRITDRELKEGKLAMVYYPGDIYRLTTRSILQTCNVYAVPLRWTLGTCSLRQLILALEGMLQRNCITSLLSPGLLGIWDKGWWWFGFLQWKAHNMLRSVSCWFATV